MIKNILKISVIALLFLCIVAIPFLGLSYYDFGYDTENKTWFSSWETFSNGIFEENAVLTNRQFGGGTSVFLTFEEADMDNITEEDYQKVANILRERFHAMGYTDTETSVTSDKLIQIDFSEKTYVDANIASVAAVGDWSLNGTSSTTTICNGSMVQDAYVTSPITGGYAVEIKFTEEGAKQFKSNVSSYAVSGSYMTLMMDGQYMGFPQISSADIGETYTLTTYNNYNDAAILASFIKHGALPAAPVIEKTVPLAADITGGKLIAIIAVVALIFVACAALVMIKGKKAGIFAVLALIANAAIFAITTTSGHIMLNVTTLVSFVVFIAIAAMIYAYALSKARAGWDALKKVSIKTVGIHAALFALALILYLTVQGTFGFVARGLLVFSCSSFIFYFLFVVFGAHTLLEIDKAKN